MSAKDKANAVFRKEERIRKDAKAVTDSQIARAAEEEKTGRLRELRLAKDAEEAPMLEKRKAPRA